MADIYNVIQHPNFDTSKMSDEEIQNKLSELGGKLVYAYELSGYGGQMISQLRNLQNILLFEQKERAAKQIMDHIKANQAKIIETEPDLQIHDTKKEQRQEQSLNQDGKKKVVPTITKSWVKGK